MECDTRTGNQPITVRGAGETYDKTARTDGFERHFQG